MALRTRDVARLERFYGGVLGLAVVRRDGARGSVWLEAGGAVVMLEPAGDDEPPVAPGTLDLLAFAVGPGEGDRWRLRLEEAGVPVEAATGFTLYFRDPDGRRVGLSAYPAESDASGRPSIG